MLSKKNRTSKKLVEKIFKLGKFVNSPNLTLKYINKEDSVPRVGFIAPKTVSKKAVDRNLLRRRGYSVLKNYLTVLPFGFAGVFIFNKKSMEIFGRSKNKTRNPALELEKEIKSILRKLK